ncbi:MAG: hypothetical protein IJ695_06280 [Butyrivibrio sp.]|nr:hypothetical protein [Butyrivibrio sp.]
MQIKNIKAAKVKAAIIAAEILVMIVYMAVLITNGKNFTSVLYTQEDIGYASDLDTDYERAEGLMSNQIDGATDLGQRRRLVFPATDLIKGVYQVDVDYDSTVPIRSTVGAYMSADDDEGFYPYSESEKIFLTSAKSHASFYVHATDKTKVKLRVVLDDDCTSTVTVTSAQITRLAGRSLFPPLICLFILFLLLDVVLVIAFDSGSAIGKYVRDNRLIVVGLLAVILVSSLPLFAGHLLKGLDMRFHYYRIYNIAQGLRSGQFPTYIYPEFINNYGYELGLFYPDFFLYFPAFMYFVGFRLETAYKCFLFAVNVLTAVIAYFSFRRIARGNRYVGFGGTLMYVFALPRLAAVYSRGALGAASCYTFAPLFALGLVRLYYVDEEEHRIKPYVYIALGMSGFLATHVLGSVMGVAYAVIFMLFSFDKLRSKRVWLETAKSIGLTVILSAWYIVPFLANYFKIEMKVADAQVHFYDQAVIPAQLFSNHYDITADTRAALHGMNNEMPLTLGPATLVVFLIIIMVFIHANKDIISSKTRKILTPIFLCTLIPLWQATTLFPYKWLYLHFNTLYDALGIFQHSYRLLGPVSLTVSVMAVLIFSSLKVKEEHMTIAKVVILGVFAAFVIQGTDLIGAYANEMPEFEFINSFRSLDFSALYNAEFLPQGYDLDNCINRVDASDLEAAGGSFQELSQNGVRIDGYAINPSESAQLVTFPRVYYPGYIVRTKEGIIQVTEAEDKRACALIPAGFEGDITLTYKPSVFWNLSLVVSVAAFFVTMYLCIKRGLLLPANEAATID